jgi:hypothetical protein
MSTAEASRRCAAMCLPFSRTLPAALCSADPPTAIEREPKVPVPTGTAAVSPSITRMRSIGTPKRAATICA